MSSERDNYRGQERNYLNPSRSPFWQRTRLSGPDKFNLYGPRKKLKDFYLEASATGEVFEFFVYKTLPLEFADLVDIPHDEVEIEEVIFRTGRLYVPEKRSISFRKIFNSEDRGPEISRAVPMSSADSEVMTFLAYTLVANERYRELTPDELNTKSSEVILKKTGVLNRLSQSGFPDLVSEENAEIISRVIPEDMKDKFYGSVADWLTHLALYSVAKNSSLRGKYVFPFPYLISDERLPHPDFLPYMGKSLLEFGYLLGSVLTKGVNYHAEVLVSAGENYLKLCEKVLSPSKQVKNRDRLMAEVNSFKLDYISLLKFYQKYPGLLNQSKISPKDEEPNLSTTEEIIGKVQKVIKKYS